MPWNSILLFYSAIGLSRQDPPAVSSENISTFLPSEFNLLGELAGQALAQPIIGA
jgi:hypothetical protein